MSGILRREFFRKTATHAAAAGFLAANGVDLGAGAAAPFHGPLHQRHGLRRDGSRCCRSLKTDQRCSMKIDQG